MTQLSGVRARNTLMHGTDQAVNGALVLYASDVVNRGQFIFLIPENQGYYGIMSSKATDHFC